MIDLDSDKLKELSASFQIPTKPEVLTRLNNAIQKADADISEVANIIATDVGLSSSILKVINSPAYGLNRQISEIEQAAVFLGINTLETIATTIKLKENIKGKACISLERFWDDAVDIAEAMRFVGSRVKNQISVNQLYTLGLFHDCGIPLMSIRYPDYKNTLIEANKRNISLPVLEMQKYNTSHAIVGYFVAVSWNLPKDICNLIQQHHDHKVLNEISDSPERIAFSVLKVAENVVHNIKRFKNIAEWETVKPNAFELLSLSDDDYTDIQDDYALALGGSV
ncbi:HDOD domain-containing protein [Tenacibaculum sp. KUL152]|nr:HDOD domain-containing protein [Tenacibaculum sp. KUL152]